MVTVDRLTTGYVGLSTDEKPTVALRNGDTFVEMDTNKLYAYNEETGEWVEQASAGGSGGGGSSSGGGVVFLEGTIDENYNISLDASYNDIVEYFEEEKAVYIKTPIEIADDSGFSQSGYNMLPCIAYYIQNGFDDDGNLKISYIVEFDGNMQLSSDSADEPLAYIAYPEDDMH